jgi:hypothetical protein
MELKEELGLDRAIETPKHECLLSILYTAAMLHKASHVYFKRYGISDVQFNVLLQLQYAKDRGFSRAELILAGGLLSTRRI